jgi:hypothetical protein
MGLLTYIITWILEPFLNIANFVAVLIKYVKVGSFWKVVNDFFYQASVSKDRQGNFNYRNLFNIIFIKKTAKHKFGNILETISSVLGKNQLNKELNIGGWIMVIILWVMVHPKHWKVGHCVYYIENID